MNCLPHRSRPRQPATGLKEKGRALPEPDPRGPCSPEEAVREASVGCGFHAGAAEGPRTAREPASWEHPPAMFNDKGADALTKRSQWRL